MMQTPFFALGDPAKLARLSPEQRTEVADRLGVLVAGIDSLTRDVDRWTAESAPPAPSLVFDRASVLQCHWCPEPATRMVREVVLDIPLGSRPCCPIDHQEVIV